jgi:hypothetical protein
MNKETVILIMKFLERTDLKGSEVMAFNKVINDLNEYVKSLAESEDDKEK